jgi:hypothetical protein
MIACSQEALASKVKLACDYKNDNLGYENNPSIILLDETHGTVEVHFSTIYGSRSGRGGDMGWNRSPAYTLGPIPAHFGTSKITFSEFRNGAPYNWILNRLTGKFYAVDNNGNVWWPIRFCHAARNQF